MCVWEVSRGSVASFCPTALPHWWHIIIQHRGDPSACLIITNRKSAPTPQNDLMTSSGLMRRHRVFLIRSRRRGVRWKSKDCRFYKEAVEETALDRTTVKRLTWLPQFLRLMKTHLKFLMMLLNHNSELKLLTWVQQSDLVFHKTVFLKSRILVLNPGPWLRFG